MDKLERFVRQSIAILTEEIDMALNDFIIKFGFAYYNRLPADLLKQEFISNGKGYAIIRIELRNPKYPVLARGLIDNLVYMFSVDQVKEALERTKKV